MSIVHRYLAVVQGLQEYGEAGSTGRGRAGCAGVALLSGLAVPSTALSAPIAGAVRYMAVTGNDDNNCSSTHPCRTIGKALARSRSGDSIVVGPGTYLESLTVRASVAISGRCDSGAVQL